MTPPVSSTRRERVLVVDDDRLILRVARLSLERAGFDVAAADSIAAASSAASAEPRLRSWTAKRSRAAAARATALVVDHPAVNGYISSLDHVEVTEAWGYFFFFYRDERTMPFATLIAKDTEHDRVSDLDRPGVYRLNIGVEKETFRRLFADAGPPDFTALDRLMPHPEYAAQSWLCVLAPTDETFERDVKPLLDEAYRQAAWRYERKS